MKSRKGNTHHVLVLAEGEEVVQTILDYCVREKIQAAWIQGMGAVKHVQVGYYDQKTREYILKIETGPFEVASMQGNIATATSGPFMHLHAALSRMDDSLECLGAHVKQAVVAVTLEIMLTPFEVPAARVYNEKVGINLLDI